MLVDKIKSMANRQALYGESSNPFRRTRTWDVGRTNPSQDVENEVSSPEVRRVPSEPTQGRRKSENVAQHTIDDAIYPSTVAPDASFKGEIFEMIDSGICARSHEYAAGEAVLASQSKGRAPDEKQNVRQRFTTKWQGNKSEKSENTRPATNVSSRSNIQTRFTVASQLRRTIFSSWINILLIAAPVGIAAHYANISPIAVFVTNFIAIIPLTGLLSFATEEIALRVGETIGGLLNVAFGSVHITTS